MACKVEKLTTDGARAVAVAVIDRALLDLRGRGLSGTITWRVRLVWNDYVKAVLWLASSRATIWFDLLSLNQERCLLSINWCEYALDLLMDDRADLSEEEKLLLQHGIERLQR